MSAHGPAHRGQVEVDSRKDCKTREIVSLEKTNVVAKRAFDLSSRGHEREAVVSSDNISSCES